MRIHGYFQFKSFLEAFKTALNDWRFYSGIVCGSGTIAYSEDIGVITRFISRYKDPLRNIIVPDELVERYPTLFDKYFENFWPKYDPKGLPSTECNEFVFGKNILRNPKIFNLRPGRFDRLSLLSIDIDFENRNAVSENMENNIYYSKSTGSTRNSHKNNQIENDDPKLDDIIVFGYPQELHSPSFPILSLFKNKNSKLDEEEKQMFNYNSRVFLLSAYGMIAPNPIYTGEVTRLIKMIQPDLIVMEKMIHDPDSYIKLAVKLAKKGNSTLMVDDFITGSEFLAAGVAGRWVPGCRSLEMDIVSVDNEDDNCEDGDNRVKRRAEILSRMATDPDYTPPRPSYLRTHKRDRYTTYQLQQFVRQYSDQKFRAAKLLGVEPEPLVVLFLAHNEHIRGVVRNWCSSIRKDDVADSMSEHPANKFPGDDLASQSPDRYPKTVEAKRRLRLGFTTINLAASLVLVRLIFQSTANARLLAGPGSWLSRSILGGIFALATALILPACYKLSTEAFVPALRWIATIDAMASSSSVLSKVEHSLKHMQFFIRMTPAVGNGISTSIGRRSPASVLNYKLHKGSNVVEMYHTEVPPEHRGRGFAQQLVKEAFKYCLENNYRVLPTCSYVQKYVCELATDTEKRIIVDSITK